ncbi:sugar transporter SWEET1 [Harpegnathos saltator]|nr:sugar transporter SWEET1 [Harpegnathos saltator]
MILEEYKEIVGTCAMYITMLQMLAGTVICKDIYQKGTSKSVDPMPFLGAIGVCTLMLRYAWMLSDPAMINVNVFGIITNTVYMTVYYYYAANTRDVLNLIGKVTVLITVFLVYAQIEHPSNVEFRFGILVTILLLLLIAAPLVHLREIIKTKNTEILPFPLILMGTLVSFSWLLYGFIIDNAFVVVQNAVGFTLNIIQLSLFVIFPSKMSHDKLLNEQRKKD